MAILTRMQQRRRWMAAALAMLVLAAAPARAQDAQPKLYKQKIEAGLIYNFLKYTTWPDPRLPTGKSRLRVCLFGGDPFDGYLNPLQGRTAQQYLIDIAEVDSMESLNGCHLVVIDRNEEDRLPEILAFAKSRGFLTVSDIDRFASQGGMVEFATGDDQRIHLLLNRQSINAAGIRIAERMARLAEPGRGG